ncbi:hypothetical protein [Adhaeribacter arboris]|nr:hypothetical protein [Adhaeribacter arboris]
MPYIHLRRTESSDLYLAGFATWNDLKEARDRAKAQGIVIIFWGEAEKVKAWQATRWVYKADYTSFGLAYQDYQYPMHQGKMFSTPLASFQSALDQIGNPKFILIWRGQQ